MTSLRLRTPAKINIFLRVLGRRADNYHELETLFQAIELYDELIIRKKKANRRLIVRNDAGLQNENNLVLRALEWLEKLCDSKFEVEIELVKNIPVAAGLGGGSSDAAATLLGLKRLLDLDWLSSADIERGALSLGADVPFFILGGTAIGRGIGERLTPVGLNCDYSLLLVNPGFAVSTGEIFSAFSKTLTEFPKKVTLQGLLDQGVELSQLLVNDLQGVAESMYPEIRLIRETLIESGVTEALMTGSGPTVFALGSLEKLEALKDRFGSKYRVILTRPSPGSILID
jgi:4-diphosphocytidyl-2-C-methyl-D-erythritol kinase